MWGSTVLSAAASGTIGPPAAGLAQLCSSRATSSAITSESLVAIPGSMPIDDASSSVLVRLPLCPKAKLTPPASRYTGCALCHVEEPVVE